MRTTKTIFRQACLCAISICMFNACENSDKTPKVDLGVDGDKVISELTTNEQEAVYQGIQAAMKERLTKDTICQVFAFYSGFMEIENMSMACEAKYSTCKASSDVSDLIEEWDMDFECDLDPSMIVDCEATISEMEVCMQEVVEAIDNNYNMISCDSYNDPPNFEEIGSGLACDSLITKCLPLEDFIGP
jgi:hypothetical protein